MGKLFLLLFFVFLLPLGISAQDYDPEGTIVEVEFYSTTTLFFYSYTEKYDLSHETYKYHVSFDFTVDSQIIVDDGRRAKNFTYEILPEEDDGHAAMEIFPDLTASSGVTMYVLTPVEEGETTMLLYFIPHAGVVNVHLTWLETDADGRHSPSYMVGHVISGS